MEYLHGKDHHQNHNHDQNNNQNSNPNQNSNHTHNHEQMHDHPHEHRGMHEIREIIEQGKLTEQAKKLALRIFTILAEAESKAHNRPLEEVHFHEVGAVDSIIDIVAAAVCLDNLQINEVIVPKLYEGHGMVRCQHGLLPVPVPAVVNIIQAHNLNLQLMEMEGEFITPTGAAIVAAIKTLDILPSEFRIRKIGIGAGKRKYERPSILRAMIIESAFKDRI
jgi:uncharacterized protein (DUF111 family)